MNLFWQVGIVVYEMFYVVGFVYEYICSDCDEYVGLIKENLGGNINNINMCKVDIYDFNFYDYESIM